jgi:hypothetical protein
MGRGDSRSEGRRLRESDSWCALDRESRRLGEVGLLDDIMSVVEDMVCMCQSSVPLLKSRACEASGSVQAKKKDGVVAAQQQTKFALSWKQVPAVACRPDRARWI